MNKGELIDIIAEMCDITKKDIAAVLDAFETAVGQALGKGDEVILKGFGTFKSRVKAARTGRNPATGEEVDIAETTYPSFKTGASLKRIVALAAMDKKSKKAAKAAKKADKEAEPTEKAEKKSDKKKDKEKDGKKKKKK